MRSTLKVRFQAAAVGLSVVSAAAPALAQEAPSAAAAAALGIEGRGGGATPENGIPLAGWMFYPSLFAGAVFNDNVYATPTDRRAATGVRLRPSFTAELDNGIHKTSVYGTVDAQFYPGVNGTATHRSPSNVSALAGLSHLWEPTSDLQIRFAAGYSRQNGLFGSNFGAGAPITPSPSVTSVAGSQQFSNQFNGTVSVEKEMASRTFVRATAGATYVTYDNVSGLVAPVTSSGQEGVSYTGALRGGYWVIPQVNAFVEAGGDWRRYNRSIFDTNGYRVVGGLASDLIGLMRGEIYAGYQSQSSASGAFGDHSMPAFGARLYYYPTRDLTFTASVDQTFGAAAAWAAPSVVVPANNKTVQAKLQADYALAPYWTVFARGGYGETRWITSPRVDDTWVAGIGTNYTFWRNVALTFEYRFTKTDTNNIAAASYRQNLVSAGMTYRY